ncbi:MAG: hypothetical protein PSV36_00710 [Algoriphagus sp.]|nr:hypothetical protein [Algoriphagus sp.]
MENISIHHLQHFITEDLFLLKEEMGLEQEMKEPVLKYIPKPTVKPEIPEEKAIVAAIKAEPIQVRGNFEKGILILHEEESLKPEVMDMLVKMINAVGHSMNEVGLLASGSLESRTMEDFKNLNAHTVLKFGRIKHPVNSILTNLYEVYSEDETEYISADALSVIAEDKNLKKKLWTALQVLFNISK